MKNVLLLILLILCLPVVTQAEDLRETIYACKGGVVSYNGRNYTPGTYTVRQSGKPNIILTVLEAPTYRQNINDTIFVGDSYIYKGVLTTFKAVGISRWTDELTTIRGCDSIINHVLVVQPRPTTYSSFEVHICKGDSAQVAGRWYKTKGSNTVTLKGANSVGGDSVITFRVYVHEAVTVTSSMSVLEGTSKQWYYHRFSSLPPGTYRLTSSSMLHTVHGCDSLEVLYLTVLPRTEGHTVLHLCNGEEVEQYGMKFSQHGDYEVHIPNTAGGDSLLHVAVRVHEPVDTTVYAQISYGDSVMLCDTLIKPGQIGELSFVRRCATVHGCDSTVRLQMTVGRAKQQILWTGGRDTVAVGQHIDIPAVSSAGLPVSYSWTPEHLVSIDEDGGMVAEAVGWLEVTASVEGDDFYLPAQPLTRSFVILRHTALPEIEADPDSYSGSGTGHGGAPSFKCLRNGSLCIFNSGSWYDFTGRRLQ